MCPAGARVAVGKPAQITIAATVEATPVTDVEFTFPPQVRLNATEPTPQWTSTVIGQRVRYRGPAVQPFTCKYFSVQVTAVAKGAYRVSFVQRDGAGKVVAQSDPNPGFDPCIEQMVYVAVRPLCGAGSSGGRSLPSPGVLAGIALIGFGVVAALLVSWRNRRLRKAEEREDQLDARVAAFRARARDRQPAP